jgi:hypothetical protein
VVPKVVIVVAYLLGRSDVLGPPRFGQGVTLGRDAGLVTTLLSAPVLVTVVALLD